MTHRTVESAFGTVIAAMITKVAEKRSALFANEVSHANNAWGTECAAIAGGKRDATRLKVLASALDYVAKAYACYNKADEILHQAQNFEAHREFHDAASAKFHEADVLLASADNLLALVHSILGE